MSFLTTHEFEFRNAPEAYAMIMERSEPYVGLVLKYDAERMIETSIDIGGGDRRVIQAGNEPMVSFIGAGSFAQNLLLPNLKNSVMVTVATSQGHTSKNVAQKWGFRTATCDVEDVFNDSSNTVFIATRHDSHAEYVKGGLEAGKNVFVEKPLCLTEGELEEIADIYRNAAGPRLMVGFNRRFAPQIRTVKKEFSDSVPKSINYRINAGAIPADHWIQDRDVGGGRIIGEVCHFVDLAMFLAGSLPKSLSAHAMDDPGGLLDTLSVSILFRDGSIANISYFANGSKALKKERIEVFSSGKTAVVDDFSKLDIYTSGKASKGKLSQDKGHAREVGEFLDSIRGGEPAPISFEEIYYSTKMSFDIIRSITSGKTIDY
jgi:polar amino acid transport system substrate-binding protein